MYGGGGFCGVHVGDGVYGGRCGGSKGSGGERGSQFGEGKYGGREGGGDGGGIDGGMRQTAHARHLHRWQFSARLFGHQGRHASYCRSSAMLDEHALGGIAGGDGNGGGY